MNARDYLHKNDIKPDQNIEVRIYGKNATLIKPLHKLLDEYLTEQLILHGVSNRRELLLDYEEWLNEYPNIEDRKKQVDKYLNK